MGIKPSQSAEAVARKKWISDTFRAAWPQFTVLVFVTLCNIGLQLLNPWPLKLLVDSVFGTTPAPGLLEPYSGSIELLTIVALAYLLLYMVSGFLDILDTYLTVKFTSALSVNLQAAFFNHILNLPLETRRKVESGDYVYRLNEEADNLPSLLLGTYVSIASSSIMIVSSLIILGTLNWQMALIGTLIVPLLMWSIHHFTPLIGQRSEEQSQESGDLYNMSSESIENATIIQAFNRQRYQVSKFSNLLKRRAATNLRLGVLGSQFEYTNNLFTAIGTASILLIGGYKVFNGSLTVGELLVFVTYMSFLYAPLQTILSSVGDIKSLMAGIKRVFEILFEPSDANMQVQPGITVPKVAGHIVYRDVSFMRGDKIILNRINIDIQPGKRVALIGPSGGGKSTILSLLPRFNYAESGNIYVDGNDIMAMNVESLRSHIGFVSQEAALFSGTISDNITFAMPEENFALPEIVAAAEAANAYEFIKSLPEGIQTDIGESGDNLSGGQKQRISLARAFIKNPPILLLDEPTSALDRESGSKLLAAIKKLMVGKTVIMATHEVDLLKQMDVIYLVDKGRVTDIADRGGLEAYLDSLAEY